MPVIYAVIILLALLALAGILYEAGAEAADRKRFPPPGRIFPAGGARLHLLVEGERAPGAPVVLLESGQGSWSLAWRELQPQIAGFARVLAYDRAGLGWSSRGMPPRTPERMVAELHALLQDAGEPGPYVLVGQGMSASLVRLFAARFPQETAALVLIDPLHERLESYLPATARSFERLVARSRAAGILARFGLARLVGPRLLRRVSPGSGSPALGGQPDPQALLTSQTFTPHFFEGLASECQAFLRPENWQGLPGTLGDLFLVIIAPESPPAAPPGIPPADWEAASRGTQAMRADLLGLSTRSHLFTVEAGSDPAADHPETVLAAVQAAVEISALRPAGSPGIVHEQP